MVLEAWEWVLAVTVFTCIAIVAVRALVQMFNIPERRR